LGRLTHRTAPGWTYFVTTKSWQSTALFQVEAIAEIVMAKPFEYREKKNYLLHEFVLMPNHLHVILTPADSVSLERALQLIKGGSSYEIHRVRGGKMQIWQLGFHESRVKNSVEYATMADYVRFNPVTAKLVEKPEDWPFGSACGRYPLDPIPQGLKPRSIPTDNVGPKGPTPNFEADWADVPPRKGQYS
jgi:putative transposase